MPSRRSKILVIARVLVFVGASVVILVMRTLDGDSHLVQAAEPICGEVHTQQRIEAIRQQRQEIVAESFEATVKGLLIDKPYFESGVHDPGALRQLDFKRILSNRRTHKLIAHLAELPTDVATKKYQEIFDDFFENEHKATIERVLKSYEERGAPKNTQWMDANKLALGAVLFGMAHLGKPAMIVNNLRRMDAVVQETADRVECHKELYPSGAGRSFAWFIDLDNACKISLLAYAMEHSDPQTTRQDAIQRILTGTLTRKRPLTAWDAETTTFDADSFFANVRVDRKEIIEDVTVYEWTSSYVVDRPFQADVVNKLMTLCAPGD